MRSLWKARVSEKLPPFGHPEEAGARSNARAVVVAVEVPQAFTLAAASRKTTNKLGSASISYVDVQMQHWNRRPTCAA